ncbi:hypothetical protein [uncultured Aquimarina sp.]|uniref:hypothetical protein n=1 Tax=uncultured Aquimarina sp. TaxID=575652 RepID=UPI00260C8F0D|nr:hypothetical protein [uncultured Aquimarina sp.]
MLEYALAGLGMVLNTSLNLGVPGAYPFYKLRKKDTSTLEGFALHYMWLLFFFLVIQICYYSIGFSIEYYMALNMAYIISNQVFISTQLKTDGKIIKAVFFDSGVYLLLLVFITLAYLDLNNKSLENINRFVLFYSLFYVGHSLFKALKINKITLLKYYKIIKFSCHLLFSAMLIFFITVSGRFLIEFFLKDFELVGIYSFYFRLAALVVMIYQIVSIAFFRDIYTLNPKTLDKYFTIFFIGLYLISNLSFILSQYIVPFFSDFYKNTIDEYQRVYFILSAQVVFWISSALMSNIIDREELAKKITPLFLVLIILFLSGSYISKDFLNLSRYTIIHFVIFYIAAMLQIWVLYKKKIVFRKSAISLLVIFSITLSLYFTNYSF